MRKRLVYILVLWSMGAMGANPGFATRGYSLSCMAGYGYNATWGHHGNMDVQAFMPIHAHFEMEAKVMCSTANVYTGAVSMRPKFGLPVGELFIESDVMYRAVARNRLGDFTAALGVGYRMDYVSLTLGVYGRVWDNWDRSYHSEESYVTEPFNLLYRLEAFCRPQTSRWNLSFCISNIDDHHMERMQQPLFMIGGYYDVAEHWRLRFGAQCKPTGMFHLDATFYGATVRTGFTYVF